MLGAALRVGLRLRAGVAGAAAASGVALYAHSQLHLTECRASGPDWYKVKKQIVDLCDDESALNPSVDGAAGSKGGGGYVGPMLVRLAWHSSGSYGKQKNDGGARASSVFA